MIAIIDYGLGNVQAIANIYRRLNIPAEIVSRRSDLDRADKIILPGVGAFDWAMARLNDSGLRQPLDEMVIGRGRPALGICVGMQMMGRRSDEGALPGLGWIPGEVYRFDAASFNDRTRLPHMGWNDVEPRADARLFKGLEHDARFYFLHSYYFAPDDQANMLATTSYHGRFAASIAAGSVYGVQFHPEKSHGWGVQLLRNFAEL